MSTDLDRARQGDIAHGVEQPRDNPISRLFHELLSNRHRGGAALRSGGGIHPVPDVGYETGGEALDEPFDFSQFTAAEVQAALVDVVAAHRAGATVPVSSPEPLEVYTRPGRSWSTSQYVLPAAPAAPALPQPVLILGRNAMRLTVAIAAVTVTSGAVYLSPAQNLQATNGWPMVAGDKVSFPSIGEIWAINTSTTTSTVAMLAVHRDGV